MVDIAAQGIEVCQADFTKPETLSTAFAGANRLLIISTDDEILRSLIFV